MGQAGEGAGSVTATTVTEAAEGRVERDKGMRFLQAKLLDAAACDSIKGACR